MKRIVPVTFSRPKERVVVVVSIDLVLQFFSSRQVPNNVCLADRLFFCIGRIYIMKCPCGVVVYAKATGTYLGSSIACSSSELSGNVSLGEMRDEAQHWNEWEPTSGVSKASSGTVHCDIFLSRPPLKTCLPSVEKATHKVPVEFTAIALMSFVKVCAIGRPCK
jgi:hypothetical protein